MAQKNIDFGSFPDDPDADAIRSAFQKTQENFSEIFAGLADQGVLSINKTKQTGITVSSPTGNVLISADFACLTVQSTTLSLQVSNGAAANTQVITSGSQVLQINIPSTANISNANISGNLRVNGWANFGNAISNVVINEGNISATGILSVIGNANVGNIGAGAGVFTGAITGSNTLGITGNANVGNLGTGGLIVATGNITGGNLVTGGALSVTGNANIGNLGAGLGIFSSNVSAGNISTTGSLLVTGNANVGNLNGGNLVVANFLGGTLTTSSQPNITSVGVLTGLDANGNITAVNITANTGVFTGNGSGLTNIAGGNVTGQVANALVAGTVYTSAQPNITSVGTLTGLSVTGNLSAGNVAGGNLVSANFLQGTLTTNAQPNITSVGILSSLNVTGNIGSGNLQTTNVVANANITAGNVYANSGTIGANLLAGTLTTNAQPNITSVGTLSNLSVSGNLSAGNVNGGNLVSANFFQGDGYLISNLTVSAGTYIASGTSNVAILTPNGNVQITVGGSNVLLLTNTTANITGTLNVSGNANVGNLGATTVVANLQGGLLTNSQPNITTVGTLTGLTVNGISNLGSNGNVIITGGPANSFLMTNGSGNLSWNSATLLPAQGSNTQIIFNDATNYAGNTGFTFDKTSGNVAIPGALSVAGNISGNRITGTLVTANQPNIVEIGSLGYLIVSATGNNSGNINAANVIVVGGAFFGNGSGLTNLPAGNISGQVANAIVAGTVYTASQPNITSVGTLTSLSVTGNITSVSGVFNGNGAGLTNLVAANITGTIANATHACTANTVTSAAQSNITSLGTLTGLNVNGNVTAGNITANTGVISGNGSGITSLNASQITTGTLAQARLANSNIIINGTTISLGGSATITASNPNSLTLGSFLTGTSYDGNTAVTAAVDATSTNTANKIVARDGSGNFSAGTITANLNGTASLATTATTAGTVTTAAQPNITSVGTLTTLGVNGTVTAVAFTANTGIFSGNGSGLTALNASQLLTGTVPASRLSGNYTINVDVANTVASAAQPNITSVGTLTSLTSSGNISAANVIASSYHIRSVQTGITAAGSTQGAATAINKEINIVVTVSAGANGVVLPTAVAGMVIIINNTSGTSLNVYPATGAAINTGATNAAYNHVPGASLQYYASSSTQWYTVGATYS